MKDIQIFGMSSWLRQVHDAVLKLFRDFQLREQRVRLLGDLAEVALTFLRNGAAYGYLLALALGEGLSVSEFLLYFTAVGNFTTWVTGILKGFGELHQFSLELSSVRSYIEAPEPFRMEGGKAIEPGHLPAPTPWSCGTCPSGTPGRRRTPCPTFDPDGAARGKAGHCGPKRRGQNHLDEAVLRPAGPHRRPGAPQRGGHPGLQPAGLLPAVLHGVPGFLSV